MTFGTFWRFCFERLGHESCWCSGVSKALLQGILSKGFNLAAGSYFFRLFRRSRSALFGVNMLGPESCWRSNVSKALLQGIFSKGFSGWILFLLDCSEGQVRQFLTLLFEQLGHESCWRSSVSKALVHLFHALAAGSYFFYTVP